LDSWGKALAASDQKAGNTGGAVTLGKPTREIVSADHGYIVLPAVYTYKAKGIAMREAGQMVCALQQATGSWQITAFAWVGARSKPVAATAK
jgi:hypothetical protein